METVVEYDYEAAWAAFAAERDAELAEAALYEAAQESALLAVAETATTSAKIVNAIEAFYQNGPQAARIPHYDRLIDRKIQLSWLELLASYGADVSGVMPEIDAAGGVPRLNYSVEEVNAFGAERDAFEAELYGLLAQFGSEPQIAARCAAFTSKPHFLPAWYVMREVEKRLRHPAVRLLPPAEERTARQQEKFAELVQHLGEEQARRVAEGVEACPHPNYWWEDRSFIRCTICGERGQPGYSPNNGDWGPGWGR